MYTHIYTHIIELGRGASPNQGIKHVHRNYEILTLLLLLLLLLLLMLLVIYIYITSNIEVWGL